MARSTWVAYAFEWGKLLKCLLKGKTSKKLAIILKNENGPRATSVPALGLKYYNIQTCLLVYAADLR